MGILDKIFRKNKAAVPSQIQDQPRVQKVPETPVYLADQSDFDVEAVGAAPAAELDREQTKPFKQTAAEIQGQQILADLLEYQQGEAKMAQARALHDLPEVYILLSEKQANLKTGQSRPYVGQLPDGRQVLLLFATYDLAKAYLEKNTMSDLDGNLPIARLTADEGVQHLTSLLNLAQILGVELVAFNPMTPQAFGFDIPWYFEVNDLKLETEVQLVVSDQEAEKILTGQKSAVLQFNLLPIEGFSNPFEVSDERLDELVNGLFYSLDTQELITHFQTTQSLHENVYLWDLLTNQLIPEVEKANRPANLTYYQVMQDLLNHVISRRLLTTSLFSLHNPVTGDLQVKHGTAYLLYTKRYEALAQLDYQATMLAEFVQQCQQHQVYQVVVTDGTDVSACLDLQLLVNACQAEVSA